MFDPIHLGLIQRQSTSSQPGKKNNFVALLRYCAKKKDLSRGARAHDDILRRGLLKRCSDDLVTMYAKCGALLQAQELFDKFKSRDVVTWTSLIAGYANEGRGRDALKYFEEMEHEGLSPDAVTFTCILKACGSIRDADRGKEIHDVVAKQGLLGRNLALGNALVDMYAKCGALSKAQHALEELPVRNVISWTALITGYVEQGECLQAISCFDRMQGEGIRPNGVTFICILKACGMIRAMDRGEEIHGEIRKQGLLNTNIVLGNALVDMYVRCFALAKAREVLQELPVRNVVTWTTLIGGYVQQDEGAQALECFERMQDEGIIPNDVTFISILKACGTIEAVDKGERVHDEVAKKGLLGRNIVLDTALVEMYARSGALAKARQVLEDLPVRDVFMWTALISGYIQWGEGAQALDCYEQMKHDGIYPNDVTFICILKVCGSIRAGDKGEEIHDQVSQQGWVEKNIMVGKALIEMYAKCGALAKAQHVLKELPARDSAAWSALITGHVEQSECAQALGYFNLMKQEGFSPDAAAFVSILKACGIVGAVEKGEAIHHEIAKQGLLGNNLVLGTALVDMYAKCGALGKAQHMLEGLPVRDVVSWNALITGYAQRAEDVKALACFECMQREGLSPGSVTFMCLLKACGNIGAADKGERIHDEIDKQGLLRNDIVLGTSLVEMYAKCGALTKARQVLEELPVRDVFCWNALIAGHAQLCESAQAITCFKQMQQEGLSPDAATLSCILSACSRSSLVEDAAAFFVDVSTKYGITPEFEHFTCMVDLFGRAGHLDMAVGVAERMPYSNIRGWSALLGASRKWGDVFVGRWSFEQAIQVDKTDAAFYVLMIDIYVAAGMQEDAENVEALRMENRAWNTRATEFV